MTSAAILDKIIATAPGTVPVATIESAGVASFPEAEFSVSEEGAVSIKHRTCFTFKGYGTADGTNYEAPELLTDANAPFEHDTSYGTNGLTAQTPQQLVRSGGTIMTRAAVLTKWTGWATSAGSGTIDIGLLKVTMTSTSSSNVTPVLLKNTQFSALGNTKPVAFAETSFSVAVAAGDMVYTAVKGSTDNKAWFFTSTLEVQDQ